MPHRKHKKYRKPKRPFDKARIDEENVLIKKYGLKNKREMWKAESAIENIRKQAKLLLTKTSEEQTKFIERLKKQGFRVESVADVLALNKEEALKYLSDALKQNPNNVNARFHFAKILKKIGQTDSARQHFEEVLWSKFETPLKKLAQDEIEDLL